VADITARQQADLWVAAWGQFDHL